jgi:hypothetical protein
MATEDTNGDIEIPKLPDVAENSPGEVRSDHSWKRPTPTHSGKRKVICFGAFLFFLIGLLIALGITIGGNAGDSTDSSANAIGSAPEIAALDNGGAC